MPDNRLGNKVVIEKAHVPPIMIGIMTRTKATAYSALVITGYILYGLLFVSVLLSTVFPWGELLLRPQAIRYNVILSLVALTVGALLPTVIGYLVGDKTTKSKNRLNHHFNGVLFGLLSYWIMLILSAFVTYPYDLPQNTRMIIINLVPSLGVLIISVPLAIAHARGRQAKHDIIEYQPYGIVLTGSIAFMLCMSLASSIRYNGLEWLSAIPLAVTLGLGAVSYWTLHKSGLNVRSKVNWSAISVSVAAVATFVMSLLCSSVSDYINATPSMGYQATITIIGWALGLVGWATYWWIQARSLSKNQTEA